MIRSCTDAPSRIFYAFDCLWADGRDLRGLPLTERKRILRHLVPQQPSRLFYVDHAAGKGKSLYAAACSLDLEGIVAKQASARYGTEPPSWNPNYTQMAGRHERFEAMRAAAV